MISLKCFAEDYSTVKSKNERRIKALSIALTVIFVIMYIFGFVIQK